MPEFGLGRRIPPDMEHVRKYALRSIQKDTTKQVKVVLPLPSWSRNHNQGSEGACVGFGSSMMMAILNLMQAKASIGVGIMPDVPPPGAKPELPHWLSHVAEAVGSGNVLDDCIRYDPWWLWDRAKESDPWTDTNPGDQNGTTVRSAVEVLMKQGHCLWEPADTTYNTIHEDQDVDLGIQAVRWATTVDEMRTAIASRTPIAIGVDWYSNFGQPTPRKGAGGKKEWWIGRGTRWGRKIGGHCLCVMAADDDRDAFGLKNSWGPDYPDHSAPADLEVDVWIPYNTMQKLLDAYGEACLVVDK